MKKFIAVALIAGTLAACDDTKINAQSNTDTVRYGRTHVAFLMEQNTPPGCQLWHVYPYKIDGATQQKVIPMGASKVVVTLCQGEGQPSKTSWQEQVGKTQVTRDSFTGFLSGIEGER